MILTTLSMQRVTGRTPHVPNNEERRRAWETAKPVQMGNGYDWRHCQAARYAKQEAMDARTPTTDTGF